MFLYLLGSSQYSADQEENIKTLTIGYNCCLKLNKFNDALRIALKLDDTELVQKTFDACKDRYDFEMNELLIFKKNYLEANGFECWSSQS